MNADEPDQVGIGVTTGSVSIPFLWERHGRKISLVFAGEEPPAGATITTTVTTFEAT